MAQWNFDTAHTNIEFVVRHMMVTNVRGRFNQFDGTLYFDPENPEDTSVDVTIDVDSVSTGVDDRDNHLRSADFFEVEKYPNITFKSTNIEMIDDDTAKMTGDLTIKDVTKPVTLNVEFLGQGPSPFGDFRAGFEANGKIDREAFGLTWNAALETGGVLVGKDVKLQLAVQVIKEVEAETV